LLGAGSIVPTSDRFCTAAYLEAGEARILVDCGPGTLEKMRRMGISPHNVDAVFLTHYHLDHVSDLLPLIKLRAYTPTGEPQRSPKTLNIIGPSGLTELLNHLIHSNKFFEYLESLMNYRKYTALTTVEEGREYEICGLKFSSVPVTHSYGVAYKFWDGRCSVVFSGDTAPDRRLIEFARGADILIHECSFPSDLLIGQHTGERELALIVAEARPRLVVVTHLYPAWSGAEHQIVRAIEEAYKCRVIVGRDLMEIRI
jgi:ribonuclease BN (tRNA processing enzyme)